MLRYAPDGKVTEIGLGGADRVSLKLARELRDQHLATLSAGFDPREEKRGRRRRGSTARLSPRPLKE